METRRRQGAHGQMDDWAGGVRGDGDAIDPVEDGTGGVDVILQGGEDGRRVSEDVDTFRGAYGEQGRHGGREDERGTVDTLGIKRIRKDFFEVLESELPGVRPRCENLRRSLQQSKARWRWNRSACRL
jgi:hypothetical protein